MNMRLWGFRNKTAPVLLSGLFLGVALLTWLALASGRGGWSLPAILSMGTAAAAGAYLYRAARPQWRPEAQGRLLGYFLVHSVSSGVDVARRALVRPVRIDPEVIAYESRLQRESARILLAHLLSLQPGTLCCGLEGRRLVLHVLDRNGPVEESIQRLEERIGAAFD
jgi:multisubunit Na+/H+ antiporter MnhE subunit